MVINWSISIIIAISLFLVFSKGMSDSGSHGGSSKAEVEIPLTFIVDGCKPDARLNLQIDLAPTIAVLMGVPIPSNSLGSLLLGALDSLESNQKLYAAFLNAQNIALKTERNSEDSGFQLAIKLYQDWLTHGATKQGENITNIFLKATTDMSSHSIKSLAKFDLYLMIISIVFSFQVC